MYTLFIFGLPKGGLSHLLPHHITHVFTDQCLYCDKDQGVTRVVNDQSAKNAKRKLLKVLQFVMNEESKRNVQRNVVTISFLPSLN